MVELRELRANRIGMTFADRLRRDPFRFSSSSLLLWILYGITRPMATTSKPRLVPIEAAVPPRTLIPARGELWGNDDPNAGAPGLFKRPPHKPVAARRR
jgi:hypothetical protein